MTLKSILITTLSLFLTFTNIYSQVTTDSLILYLPFNGNSEDMSVFESDGIVHGASLTTDRFGSALSAYDFDGVDDYIEIVPLGGFDQIGDFTISVWYNLDEWLEQPVVPPNVIDRQYIFDGHTHSDTVLTDFVCDGFSIALNLQEDYSQNVMNFTTDISNSSFIYYLNTFPGFMNSWIHNTFIRQGSETRHYINGELIDSRYNDSTILDMNHNLYIGTFSGNNPNYIDFNFNFDGKIDDVRIYNRALNENEVSDLFNESLTISNIIKTSSFNIFPNPTSGDLNINIQDFNLTSNYKIQIINTLGLIIYMSEINEIDTNINLTDITENGIYIVRIINSNGDTVAHQKIILLY